ncbi:MAG: universal stress protein [Afipia sp.]|nr:universal stress protein [Afipia sp.]
MIRDIVINLEHDIARDVARDYAISIADRFEAHLEGVAFAGKIPTFMTPDIPAGVLAEILAGEEKLAKSAIARFSEAVKRSDISSAHHLVARSEFGPAQTFSALARRFDLSVLMQPSEGEGVNRNLFVEFALFDSGRPLIVVPYIQKNGLDISQVVCCWDGSRAAARAINDALPLLTIAEAVELLIIDTDSETNSEVELRGFEMTEHLARHGAKVELTRLSGAKGDTANLILSHAADNSAGLIVMGGYGHSRLREFVLGGVTREMLSSMTVPVLMSH